MELKAKKYIKNTGTLPGFANGIPSLTELLHADKRNWEDVENWQKETPISSPMYDPYAHNPNLVPGYQKDPQIPQTNTNNIGKKIQNNAPQAASFITTAISSFDPGFDHNDLIAGSQNAQGNVRGVKYNKKLGVDDSVEDELTARSLSNIGSLMSQGASLGNGMFKAKNGKLPKHFWGGIIGAGIGGIVGALGMGAAAQKADKEIHLANRIMDRQNQFNQNGALSTVLQQDDLMERGNYDMYKLRYKNGKLPCHSEGKNVHTSHGMEPLPQNAWGDGNEKIFGEDGSVHQLPNSRHTDSFAINTKPGDIIVPRKYADLVNTRAEALALMNNIVAPEMKAKGVPGYKKGKLPGFVNGAPAANSLLTTLGVLGGGAQMLAALSSKPKNPNTYVANPNAQRAGNILAGLRISDYPILPELYNQYAKSMYAISNSGGLSGGQKTLARLAAMKNLQDNYAKLSAANQAQNNAYNSQYADYLYRSGAQEAQDKATGIRYDLDYYSKAHANKWNAVQTGFANALSASQQGFKNKIKWDQFEDTMSLYRDYQKLKRDEIDALGRGIGNYSEDEWKRYGKLNGWLS